MPRNTNHLLGRGEKLTGGVELARGGSEKNPPYGFKNAVTRITRFASATASDFQALPDQACPGDNAVAVVTMHPRYISKSDYPLDLFNAIGGRAIGSRARTVKPDQWGVKKHPDEATTEEYFVAAPRAAFRRWANGLQSLREDHPGSATIQQVEELRAFDATSKLRNIPEGDDVVLEVVLHNVGVEGVVRDFAEFVHNLGGEAKTDHLVDGRGLTFVPVRIDSDSVEEMAQYAFVRVARGMPQLRPYRPRVIRGPRTDYAISMPNLKPQTDGTKAVIFDGGLPDGVRAALSPAVTLIEPPGIGLAVPDLESHGLAVTSAFLFGPLKNGTALGQPVCSVDHVRVLDQQTGANGDYMYLDALSRIVDHLDAHGAQYQFINLSLGPDLSAEDDEVTAWTSLLDERLAGGAKIATVAVGNTGEFDRAAGLCRIQPPSDGVNVLSVGASNTLGAQWERASYSSIGPGRTPGRVKPDGVAFGGCDDELFYTLVDKDRADGTTGTSFAAPYLLRTSAAVSLGLGNTLSPLAVRALTIHRAQPHTSAGKDEIGWGKFETDPDLLTTCDDDEAIVVYQGDLPISEHLRCALPMPAGPLTGFVHVSATLVISPEVDPNNASTYTRAGLEVFFRPSAAKFKAAKNGKKAPTQAQTKPFFSHAKVYGASESSLRDDAHKWEPCLSRSQRFRAATLNTPVFDVYYHHRTGGAALKGAKPIPYALIVGLRAPDVPDFYDRVVRAYTNVLVQMKPTVQIRV